MDKKNVFVSPEELDAQRDYMERVRRLNAEYMDATGRTRAYFVDCYGCQQNEADAETMRGMLREMGYAAAPDETQADIVLINTCAVREHAELRVLGNVGALSHCKKARPDMIIGVGGCMTQQESMAEKLKKSFPYVDLVFGTHALWRLPEMVYRRLIGSRRIFDIENEDGRIAEGLPVQRKDNIRGWVSVMYGCNNFCTYCIVPYVRGRERSRTPEAIEAEVRGLIANGCREILLLGQNVNSYGRGLETEMNFPALLRRLDAIPGDYIIRFMSSHPKDATPELIDTMLDSEHIEHHLHLPVQSGSDAVLKAMNRRYTAEKYLTMIDYARAKAPDFGFSSDLIVGFPTETDADFEETMRIIEYVKYDNLYTFIYSRRDGTPAAEMPQVSTEEQIAARMARLLARQKEICEEWNARFLGKTVRMLAEKRSPETGLLLGKTREGLVIEVPGGESDVGRLLDVRVTGVKNWALSGEKQ